MTIAIVIGVVAFIIVVLFALGLCRAAALGDAMMEEYYAELRRNK